MVDCSEGWRQADLDTLTLIVKAGELIVLPTDTVYGIGCRADDPVAVTALLDAKGRGRQMPPPVLVASAADLDRLCVDVPDEARTLANAHWPGALTLILRARPDLGWDLGDSDGTLALRMPDHPRTLDLLAATGPMAVTSANPTGRVAATDVDRARNYFGTRVAAYVDSGPTAGSTPSTILDLAHGGIRPLRNGAISLEDLAATVGHPILDERSPDTP
ncbi:L-threonylcarbamoyladenylate synthase [Schaalia sp. 19OD2882]|uniref:L-threonylcarbamoyladenylate synthase n=1 Tax=Schaalia sp. 19OD2882 TaxID=2794089 RepID=UPI0020A71BEA|nr:L-threonylcarbamoyladenylate synthase [Schaalia sp. 19OD2882]